MTNPNTTTQTRDSIRNNPQAFLEQLGQFTGTAQYYRFGLGVTLLTDGVKYLVDATGCYWLLDAIGSYQGELSRHADDRLQCLQFWTLRVNPDESAELTCVADSHEPLAVCQKIEWTDFPLPEIQIWVGIHDREVIALLPSEY